MNSFTTIFFTYVSRPDTSCYYFFKLTSCKGDNFIFGGINSLIRIVWDILSWQPIFTTWSHHSNLISYLPSSSVWGERAYRSFSSRLLSLGCRWGVCHSWSHSASDLFRKMILKIWNRIWKNSAANKIWNEELPVTMRALYPLDHWDL